MIASTAAVLLWAALYNGYPLTFWDTRAYVEHARTLLPRPDRLIGYSLLIRAASFSLTLWPVAVLQGLLVAWLLWRVTHVLVGCVSSTAYFGLVAVLAGATALPWFTGQIMADVFTPLLLLALFVLLEAHDLGRRERALLLGLLALCVSVHLTHLPIAVGLLLLALADARGAERPLARLRSPALALFAGLLAIAAFNFARSGRPTLAAGSDAFVLAHLVESGIASKELNARCDERDYMLCQHRARLPMSTDRFLWVDALGIKPWEQRELISREARRLLHDSLLDFPGLHLQVAASYTLQLLARFATGEGLDADARPLIEEQLRAYVPTDVAAFRAAKQQRDALPVATLRRVHTPFGWLALALSCALVGAAALSRSARLWREPSVRFAAFTLSAYVLNALLSANLAGLYDRYESRLVWTLALGPWAYAYNLVRRARRPCVAAS